MSLLSILTKSLLSDVALKALVKKTGLSSGKLKKLLPLAIPMLLKALTSNASSQSGGGLLGGLSGGGNKPSMGGLLGSLLGQNANERDDSLNGTALLSALLSGRK